VGWLVGGWSVVWLVVWWVGWFGGRSVQEGAFNKSDDDDGVAKFMHGMLERKDNDVFEGDNHGGVGLFAKIVQLPSLISAVLQNNRLTDIGILKPFKRQVWYSKSANGTIESLIG
jgi:hypothetical protein